MGVLPGRLVGKKNNFVKEIMVFRERRILHFPIVDLTGGFRWWSMKGLPPSAAGGMTVHKGKASVEELKMVSDWV